MIVVVLTTAAPVTAKPSPDAPPRHPPAQALSSSPARQATPKHSATQSASPLQVQTPHTPLPPVPPVPALTDSCAATPPPVADPSPAPCPVRPAAVGHPQSATASCFLAWASRPSVPMRPAHSRATAVIAGTRCEVIMDTGADLSLVSATLLWRSRDYNPWLPSDGRVLGVRAQTFFILGSIALSVTRRPLKATAPFAVLDSEAGPEGRA
ncbi:hypothetical protein Efla_001112 [Eimeria flavescens]